MGACARLQPGDLALSIRWRSWDAGIVEGRMDVDSVCGPSAGLIARTAALKLIIVSLVPGMGDLEAQLPTLNKKGKAM
jgi:hypothetical protein